MEAVIYILSSARGIFIPRDFLTDEYNDVEEKYCDVWGLTEENKAHWKGAIDPNNDDYWECWDWVLDNAKYPAEGGDVYRLHQDGDLWAVCYEKMTMEEKKNFGFD